MSSRSFIAILLPLEIEQRIDAWRAKFYPFGFSRVPAHLTIIPPFISEYYENKMYKKIEQTINLAPKIHISIDSFGVFSHHSHTFFAKVQPSTELVNLQHTISMIMNQYRPVKMSGQSYKFNPHITIANRLNDQELNQIQKYFAKESLDGEFLADRLTLLTKTSDRYQTDSEWELDKPSSLQYDAKAD